MPFIFVFESENDWAQIYFNSLQIIVLVLKWYDLSSATINTRFGMDCDVVSGGA